MPGVHRQTAIASCLLLAGAGVWLLLSREAERRPVEAGFWFDDVRFESPSLGGALTEADMHVIASVARGELHRAFDGLRLELTDARDARYGVAVVQQLRDLRARREVEIAGASRAVTGLGGSGAVNFALLASGAVACAPDGATRAGVVAAIGRGIGRIAVHEFTHQFLPRAPLHDSRDLRSYEYGNTRCEQYYGPVRWDLAWPLLQRRFGRTSHDAASR